MKPLDQIRADVLAWIALSETTSVGEDYGHRILECLGEIGTQLTNELIEAESESEPENNGFISGATWVRDLIKE